MAITEFPACLYETPANFVSDKYVHVPTINVVTVLNKHGWFVDQILYNKNNSKGRHRVLFRHNDFIDWKEQPTVLLSNSNDTTSSYILDPGIFRLICGNGLVIKSMSLGETLKVRHINNTLETILAESERIVDDFPAVMNRVEKYSNIHLNEEGIRTFGARCAQHRFENYTPVDLINVGRDVTNFVRRPEDKGNDLWRVTNRIQENLIRKGCPNSVSGRTMREVTGVDADTRINRGIWEEVEKIAEDKRYLLN